MAERVDISIRRDGVRSARLIAWGTVAASVAGIAIATHAAPIMRDVGLWAPAFDRAAFWFASGACLVAMAVVLPVRASGVVRAALFIGVGLAFAGWTVARTLDLPPDRLDRVLADSVADPLAEPALIRVEGVVRTAPLPDPPPRGVLDDALRSTPSQRFEVGLSRLIADAGPMRVSGVLSVRVDGAPASTDLGVNVGDPVRLTGRFTAPFPSRHPGQPDARPRLAMDGRVGWLTLASPELIEPAASPASGGKTFGSRVLAAIDAVRARVAEPVRAAGNDDSAGRALLLALVLGEADSPALVETRDAFRDAGAAHLLAISGFHLTILAGGVLVALRLPGDRGSLDGLIVAAFIVLYIAVLPARVPIVRAALLALALVLAEQRGHRADRITLLGWVTVGLLVWRPLDVFNLGAQLSVGVTVLLVWLAERRPAWLVGSARLVRVERTREPWWIVALRTVRTAAMTAVAAWLVAAPAIAWHTGTFSPLAPIAVLLLTPAVVGVLGFGFLAVLVGVVVPAAGAMVGDGAAVMAELTATAARTMQSIPGLSVSVPRVTVWWTLAATLAAVQACRCRSWATPAAWGPVAGVVVWVIVEAALAGRLRPGVAVRIDMLAVGDGTCIVVRSERETLVWDAGSLTPGLGVRTLPESLRALGVGRIDTAVVTHANIDHYVFVPDLHAATGIDEIRVSAWTRPALLASDAGGRLLAFASAEGIAVETFARGDAIGVGEARGVFLWPDDALVGPLAENDRAAVLRLEVDTDGGVRTVLLTGDIQRSASIMLLSQPDLLDADIVELPHHGGWHDAAPALVEAVSPTVVLQSTGPRRARASRLDERWGPIRAEIESGGGAWWVTAEDGWAWVEILRDGSMRTGSRRR